MPRWTGTTLSLKMFNPAILHCHHSAHADTYTQLPSSSPQLYSHTGGIIRVSIGWCQDREYFQTNTSFSRLPTKGSSNTGTPSNVRYPIRAPDWWEEEVFFFKRPAACPRPGWAQGCEGPGQTPATQEAQAGTRMRTAVWERDTGI